MKAWYDLTEAERVKQVYSKHSIADYWNWWNSNEPKVIEVRIRDYALIKQTVNKYGLPYSSSGVYVKSAQELKAVIAFVRDKATCWMGLNPRKKNVQANGWKTYSGGQRGGSSDDNIASIDFIFIDIDRKTKIKPANNKELKNADIMAEKIIEKMSVHKWANSYAKIASGNGVQLLFKLDVPITIPNRTYNMDKKYYEHSEEFDKLKGLVKEAVGTNIKRYTKCYEDELMVEIDTSGFNINRVCALPVTKNFKYNSYQWRGIIEMKDGTNDGLSDYILSKMNDVKFFKSKNLFVKHKNTNSKLLIKPGKLKENVMVRLLMNNDMSVWWDKLNDVFWFQLKALMRDSKVDLNSNEFREFHRELEQKYNGRFTTNYPKKEYDFNQNVVNSFCINNAIEPLYPLWPQKNKQTDMKLDEMKWGMQKLTSEIIELDSITNVSEDLHFMKNKLTSGDYNNVKTVAMFINGCIKKYGEKRAKYFVDYLFDRYFNYS